MKRPLLFLFTPTLALADPVACASLLGYQSHVGAVPSCYLDASGHASIVLPGASRVNWQNLQIMPGTNLSSLTISSGGHAVAIVDGGTLTRIDGPLASDSRLGLFSSQLQIGATGQVTAPTLLVSALPAANADAWITTGTTTVTQAPGTTGTLVNQGTVRATQATLTVLGTTVQNDGQSGGPAVMQAVGDLHLTAAGSVAVTLNQAVALSQPLSGQATINNFGSLSGFTVHLQAVPHYDPSATDFFQVNIINAGSIAASAQGSGVHLNTVHPTQPLQSLTALRPGSKVITPNAANWPTSANVQTYLMNEGEVLEPAEDNAPTAPAAPLALPKLSGTGVTATNHPAPPLAATYSSLNALPGASPSALSSPQNHAIATRGTPDKKKRGPIVKGAFFQLQYRN